MLKLVIIGGSGHWRYVINGLPLHRDLSLTGIAPGSEGEDLGSLQTACRQRELDVQTFSDYRKMLDEVKPDIVAVNSYFCDHARISLECLQRGCHIFSEKPVATTFEGLARLRQAFKAADVQFAAMFGIRYNPWFLTAYAAVQEGRIGEVRLMNAQKSYRMGTRGDNYRSRAVYGGTIPWVGSHAIDWLHWFSGKKFQSVFASHSLIANQNHGDLESTALCHFVFENEVFGSVNIDYLRPAKAPSHDDDRIRIAGTKGVIEVRHNAVYLINDQQQGVLELPLLPAGESFADFVNGIKGTGQCMVTPEDSFLITEACLKARQSADDKCVIGF